MNLIKKYEGLKLQSYLCPAGVWTIGYGITRYPGGQPVRENEIITADYAEALLNDYIIREINPVFCKIPYPLTCGQKEALSSLIYHWGTSGFLKSKLYRAIYNKKWADVCRHWDYGFKNNMNGIFKRRMEEVALFIRDIT